MLQSGRKVLAPNEKNLNLNVHTYAPTTIADLCSPNNVFQTPDVANKSEKLVSISEQGSMSGQSQRTVESVPYPFLQGFIDRKLGKRFAKRVVFDRSDYDDLLGQIVDQIYEKKEREYMERAHERDDEQKLLQY